MPAGAQAAPLALATGPAADLAMETAFAERRRQRQEQLDAARSKAAKDLQDYQRQRQDALFQQEQEFQRQVTARTDDLAAMEQELAALAVTAERPAFAGTLPGVPPVPVVSPAGPIPLSAPKFEEGGVMPDLRDLPRYQAGGPTRRGNPPGTVRFDRGVWLWTDGEGNEHPAQSEQQARAAAAYTIQVTTDSTTQFETPGGYTAANPPPPAANPPPPAAPVVTPAAPRTTPPPTSGFGGVSGRIAGAARQVGQAVAAAPPPPLTRQDPGSFAGPPWQLPPDSRWQAGSIPIRRTADGQGWESFQNGYWGPIPGDIAERLGAEGRAHEVSRAETGAEDAPAAAAAPAESRTGPLPGGWNPPPGAVGTRTLPDGRVVTIIPEGTGMPAGEYELDQAAGQWRPSDHQRHISQAPASAFTSAGEAAPPPPPPATPDVGSTAATAAPPPPPPSPFVEDAAVTEARRALEAERAAREFEDRRLGIFGEGRALGNRPEQRWQSFQGGGVTGRDEIPPPPNAPLPSAFIPSIGLPGGVPPGLPQNGTASLGTRPRYDALAFAGGGMTAMPPSPPGMNGMGMEPTAIVGEGSHDEVAVGPPGSGDRAVWLASESTAAAPPPGSLIFPFYDTPGTAEAAAQLPPLPGMPVTGGGEQGPGTMAGGGITTVAHVPHSMPQDHKPRRRGSRGGKGRKKKAGA